MFVVKGSPNKYLVKEQWPETLPNTRNGIYFYTDTKEEIWYIGKGVFSNNDGIGHRVCSHLGDTIGVVKNMFRLKIDGKSSKQSNVTP